MPRVGLTLQSVTGGWAKSGLFNSMSRTSISALLIFLMPYLVIVGAGFRFRNLEL